MVLDECATSSGAVDHVFNLRSGETEDYKIDISQLRYILLNKQI
jgi:hypothetical protein